MSAEDNAQFSSLEVISKNRDRYVTINGKKLGLNPSNTELNTPGFKVRSNTLFNRTTGETLPHPDYAEATFAPKYVLTQKVNRKEPVRDIPKEGSGIIASHRSIDRNGHAIDQVTVLHFDFDNIQESKRETYENGELIHTEPQPLYPHIIHQQNDVLCYVPGEIGMKIWDICEDKPYQPQSEEWIGDLIDLDPQTDTLPASLLSVLKPYLPENFGRPS